MLTKGPRRRAAAIASVLAATAAILALAYGAGTSVAKSPTVATAAAAGGSLTVLEDAGYEGAWPTGLDPATNTNGAANQSYMNSIFGDLFELGAGGKVINDLATGYTISNGGSDVTIHIRPGVKFTDGTPFNAAAVAFNIKRDIASPCTCSPKSVWPTLAKTNPVTTAGGSKVVIHFSAPYAAVIHSFIDSDANWIASPTALKKMGAQAFKVKPVGAGPFEVVSDTLSSSLVLKRNPGYWQSGHPLLSSLTFKAIGGDEPAYEAMLAGQGQAYEDMSTPAIIKQAGSHFTATNQLSTSPYDLQFNTKIAPFNNIKAREAIYYATNNEAIASHLFNNAYPLTQSFTGPGGLFYEPKVPGYRNYDLAKAKALVKQIGGLNVDLGTINVLVATQTTEALQSEWAQAGIKTTIHAYDLAPLIQQFTSGKWQAELQTAGSWDPASGVGVAFRFSSMSPFSGVHDPKLDRILAGAAATLNNATRAKLYAQAAAYINQMAYGPFMFAFAPANIAAKGVSGPGLTTPLPSVVVTPNILWEDVSVSK